MNNKKNATRLGIFVTVTNSHCAASRLAFQMAEELVRRGNVVDLYYPQKPLDDFLKTEQVGIKYPKGLLKCFSFKKIGAGFSLADILYRSVRVLYKKYDFLYCYAGHRPSAFIPAVLAKWIRRTKIINEWWDWFGRKGLASAGKRFSPVKMYDSLFEVSFTNAYDGVVCISNVLKQRLPNKEKAIVLHGAVDHVNLFYIEPSAAKAMLHIPSNILLIGLVSVGKGDHSDNEPFFKAFRKLISNCGNTDLKLLLTGDQQYIEQYIYPIIPKDFLIIPGWIPYIEYNTYLNACDFFVLPYPDTYRNKGRWPNKASDFIGLNKPFITNPTGDLGALIQEKGLALLSENTEESYYNLITKILKNEVTFPKSNFDIEELTMTSRIKNIWDFAKTL